MEFIQGIFKLTFDILKIKFDLFGFSVSWWNIIWFIVIAGLGIWILKGMFSH